MEKRNGTKTYVGKSGPENRGRLHSGGLWPYIGGICRFWRRNAGYLWQGVANLTGLTIGGASLAVAVVMLAFVFFYDRRQIHIGTVIYQLFYSGFVEIFSRLHVYSQSRILNFIIMCAGIVVFSFGTGLYSSANLGRGSYEAMTFALAEKNGWPVKYVRMVLDVLMVVLGVLCGGRFGVCTIATIIIAGPIIQWTVQKF